MKRQFRIANKFVVSLMLLLPSIATLLTPSLAGAISIYDDSYQSTSTLTVGGPGSGSGPYECPDVDVTTDWYSYLIDESKWHGDRSAGKTSFESALANEVNGAWGVRQYTNTNGLKAVMMFWSEDPSAELVWDADGVSVDANNGNIYVAEIICEDYMYGGNSNRPVVHIAQKSGQQRISTSPAFSAANGYSLKTLFIKGFTLNYPTGYNGTSISSPSQGGIAKGNVQCANSNNIISDVEINVQNGIDGSASISDDGNGGKNYSFYLWNESPYSLIVVCDGDPFYGPTIDMNLYDQYNWVCTHTTPGQSPNLNICATS